LLHDEFANRYWWHHIVEELRSTANVLTVDLSGSGDSEHRRAYSPAEHALEISAAVDACGVKNKVILVAHGFAFHVAVRWARSADTSSQVVMVDPLPTLPPRQYEIVPWMIRSFIKQRQFSTIDDAVSEFKTKNTMFQVSDDLLDSIVNNSLTGKEGRFFWKGDPFHISKFAFPSEISTNLATLSSWTIPTSLIYGSLSTTFTQAHLNACKALLPANRVVCVEGAGHHVFLDKPELFVGALTKAISQQVAH
jgi:pimeloyl-ACP methyl ester carboxylesterase